ncbi:MAG: hypothetical protein KKB91_13820 [Proteobacteria bacterium]|nr:hypothetical protein [Desulfocapsa sp.]MBU3945523.1 hypothetical protein [Pseudomonadota bacterium]MCG2745087.1 hypothetical protein [Desulfobacteraceae bacterium]MBU3982170.1 hypothetical protein [Pseudomonadota bacterium]MBU4029234.1 hypothetical protein [Pseudomonadota bacterium]
MQKLKKVMSGEGLLLVFVLVLFLSWTPSSLAGLGGGSGKISSDLATEQASIQTMEVLAKVKMDAKQLAQAKELIKNLSYTNMRALRVFGGLPSMTAEGVLEVLHRLPQAHISYGYIVVLEHFATLPGVDAEACWQLLEKLGNLNFVSARVAMAIGQVKDLNPSVMFGLIDRLASLKEPALWAFKAFLEVPGQTVETVDKGLLLINRMTEKQCWATEKSCKITAMTPESALANMSYLQRLSNTDAWNARSLFQLAGVTPASSLSWITNYFAVAQDVQDSQFFAYQAKDKSLLLQAFFDAGDHLIWKINNLHDITEASGQEVGIKVLSSCPVSYLREIFQRLDAKVQVRFSSEFSTGLAGGRGAAIAVLRRATAAARLQGAKDCTTANAYILISRGSDLYDSSFRDILVPVLKERIDTRFGGNLLVFLKNIDPQNTHVSDFIISLAQKGKLTLFFPDQVREQEQVLDLVAESAFQDENSLILFSATFMTLLQTIEPQTRTYLIAKMLTAIRDKNTVFSTQLRVILQYYIQEYPHLVGEVDKIRIRLMMSEYGMISFDQYVKTSFAQWKVDGKLSSLSVFHSDDDGTQSFRSNCQTLMAHGYRPRISTSFSLMAAESVRDRAAVAQLKGLLAAPAQNLEQIHQMQVRYPLVVDWVKHMNGIEISHSVVVYYDVNQQQQLLKQFLKGGHEMFVQRGHSYWRKEQLLDPLQELLKSGAIVQADLVSKQRFLSLGSCGGIRVYSELATFFHNKVDILATVGTGKAIVNNPYNQLLFELVASRSDSLSWKDVSNQAAIIFKQGMGEEYLQPGSLPAILHKIMDQKQIEQQNSGKTGIQTATENGVEAGRATGLNVE